MIELAGIDPREGFDQHLAVPRSPLVGMDRLRCSVAIIGGLVSMKEPEMSVTTIGIDHAKFVFQIHGVN